MWIRLQSEKSMLYILSDTLRTRIDEIACAVKESTGGAVCYTEYIAIPCFGQIILRFDLEREHFTIDQLDRYESLIYAITGDELLIDFMGSVYRKVGVDYSDQDAKYASMADRFKEEIIDISPHADGIRSDAEHLLKLADMDETADVWEIQVEDDALILYLLGDVNREIKQLSEPIKLFIGEANRVSCTGLMKAAFFAKRNQISLGRILLDD